jgi:hypothetical protein
MLRDFAKIDTLGKKPLETIGPLHIGPVKANALGPDTEHGLFLE